ncbi:nucleoside triphosphate pyrophosphohydrolase, partial [Yersinia intermedia]|uniref:nucleoside triphosphate pyrophosphohydrolase n=1 Tax=Yersinia intermedia TaxID=631 RepID=UPI00164375DA
YILNDNNEIDLIIKDNKCSQELINDLEQLTKRPLVIRTDGLDIPAQQHQMLPRSDELRSCEAAVKWLLGDFRNKILELDLQDKKLCLISHHFIPASASAWCLAQPNKRKVRIESLWGIPEGLYWYAHDVFDVDTKVSSIINQDNKPENFYINERLRYKGRFVAPNDNGEWVVHDVADGFDWKRSIKNKEWIEEIAWTSRKIAIHLKKPVVIMWFIDIPNVISNHAVIPWYHESWKHAGSSPKAAPRKKLPTSEEFILRTKDDWQSLKRLCLEKKQFSRVYIDPTEPDLVRDQKFAKELAGLADKNGFVIELSGGILSHAYYMLKSSGCDVECADLYATDDEEIEYNKLVRDKIPEIIHSHGEDVKLLKLEGDALITALKRKVVEEALEILDAVTSQQLIEEIADLRETINALMSKLDISDNEIEDTRKIKVKDRGAFEEGLMLEKTALSPSVDLVVEDEKTDALKFNTSKIERTIAKAEQLPGYFHDIHTDKRHDSKGTFERLFTYFLPAHGEGFNPPKTSFTLESADGSIHEYILDLSLERKGANIYCKIRMINAPKQLTLNI